MKNTLILHCTDGTHESNWYSWLGKQLEKKGYDVWVPDLPQAHYPNIQRYNQFILGDSEWKFNEKSILIGHSSGAVAVLGLLQDLPEGIQIDSCYIVGSFVADKNDQDWEQMKGLFEKPFDFDLIKTKAKKFIFIHSEDDPYCPLEQAEYLAEKVDGELIIKKGQKHFSIGTYGEEYKQFPFLLDLIMKG